MIPKLRAFSIGICLLSAICLPTSALATTWHITADGLGDAPTIQAGIDSAAVGDTVQAACGTYIEYEIMMKSGVVLRSETGDPACVTIDANGGGGFQLLACSSTTVMEGLTLTGAVRINTHAGNTYISSGAPQIRHCRFTANLSGRRGGAAYVEGNAHPVFTSCTFDNNTAWWSAGAVGGSGGTLLMQDCTFYANHADSDGGAVLSDGCVTTLVDCLFYGNSSALEGGAWSIRPGSGMSMVGCTLFGNSAPSGGGIMTYGGVTVDRSIIAFGTQGNAVGCGGGSVSFTCSDLFGNAGGDWVACTGSPGVNGNISADPGFCDGVSGDFSLRSDSPCLVSSCGRMGVFGLGCFSELPVLASLTDVPDDQGGQIRLRWMRSLYDAPGDTVDVVGYEVYRRQDAGIVANRAWPEVAAGRSLRLDGWDYVDTVPAHGDSIYQLVAPTLCDSSGSGTCWSTFFVRATTPDVFAYLDSPPDSGYSVDNLAPSVPTGLQIAMTSLTWDECPDADFDFFAVYGSETGSIEDASLIGYTVDPEMNVQASPHTWYHVTATDFAGNEGGPAVVQNTAVGAGVTHVVPAEYDVHARPSPFADRTTIAVDIPRAGHATLRIYDVRGHLVRTLVDRSVTPGRQSLSWNGRDSSGSTVPSGVYLVRLEASEFVVTRKIVRLR